MLSTILRDNARTETMLCLFMQLAQFKVRLLVQANNLFEQVLRMERHWARLRKDIQEAKDGTALGETGLTCSVMPGFHLRRNPSG